MAKSAVLAGGFAVCAFIGPAALAYGQSEAVVEEVKTVSVNPDGRLRLTASDGNVTITSWDKNEIRISSTKHAWSKSEADAKRIVKEIKIGISKRGNTVYVRDETGEISRRSFNILELFKGDIVIDTSVDLDVKLPRSMNLDIYTDNGNIRVSAVDGKISLRSDDGDVHISDLVGDITIVAGDGDVTIDNVTIRRLQVRLDDGNLDIDTVKPADGNKMSSILVTTDDGDIEMINATARSVDFSVDYGDVFLRDVTVNDLAVYLDGGDCDADLIIEDGGRVHIASDDGNIVLRLPQDISTRFNLFSNDGRIRTDFPIEIEREEGESWARGKLGDGDSSIQLKTDSGDIILRQR